MNPVLAAQQIRAAKIAREATAAQPRLAYTTATGDAPRPARPDTMLDADDFMIEEYCFLCHRPTDHLGEHDNFAALGLVEYRTTATTYYVVTTAAYDTRPDLVAQARAADDAEVAAWLARATA